jgi:hypothetical protein
MSWINSREEHARRASGEFYVADGWIGNGHGHGIQRIYETVETWGIKSRITRVLTDVPDLAYLIIGVLDQAKQFGFTRRARLSWFDETPNQLLLEIPATPDLASVFLDKIDEWIIHNYAADPHRRLIIDVCFPA